MNILVTNKYKDLINSTNIEVLKEISGVFTVSELFNNFRSMYYKKIIIDATALVNFPKKDILKELVQKFDLDKLILFLPPDNPPPMAFLSFLVSIKLYNFTDNINGLLELINNNNTYDDVKDFVVNDNSKNNNNNMENSFFEDTNLQNNVGRTIIGFKDITVNAGTTELIYMIKNQLENVYKYNVVAVEIGKNELSFYQTKNVYSIEPNRLDEFLKNGLSADIVLLDLNGNNYDGLCTDILYLVEPSLYKINRLLMANRMAFNNLKGKKVVLNKSLLTQKDSSILGKEANISIYFNIPPLNDRILNPILNDLILKLGLVENIPDNSSKGFFDIFK